jgi:hypothetical protein
VTQTVEWRLDLPTSVLPGSGAGPGGACALQRHCSACGRCTIDPALPVAAVLRRGELNAVYVAHRASGFALRAVRLGAERADGIDVLAGLRAGEKVAADAVAAGLAGAKPAR